MRTRPAARLLIAAVAFSLPVVAPAREQAAPQPVAARAPDTIDPALFSGLRWRSIGPDRGGLSIAVGGSAARPHEY